MRFAAPLLLVACLSATAAAGEDRRPLCPTAVSAELREREAREARAKAEQDGGAGSLVFLGIALAGLVLVARVTRDDTM
jgi:hypothetical protein